MRTILQITITHDVVKDKTPSMSSCIIADMVKRSINDKIGYWRENVYVKDCQVLDSSEENND